MNESEPPGPPNSEDAVTDAVYKELQQSLKKVGRDFQAKLKGLQQNGGISESMLGRAAAEASLSKEEDFMDRG